MTIDAHQQVWSVARGDYPWMVFAETLRPYVDYLLDCFGPDWLIFGPDWPVLLASGRSYTDWIAFSDELLSSVSDPERQAVPGGTALRIYRPITARITA